MLRSVNRQGKIATEQNQVAVPGFEPGLPDSESGVLTTTLYRRRGCKSYGIVDFAFNSNVTDYNALEMQRTHCQARGVPKILTPPSCYYYYKRSVHKSMGKRGYSSAPSTMGWRPLGKGFTTGKMGLS